MNWWKTLACTASISLALGSTTYAGPIIIAGTDADDHGSVSGTTNQNGWEFMQKSFERLASAVSNGNTNIVCIGCNSGTALAAFNSAVNNSSIAGIWNEFTLTNVTDITTFMTGGTTGSGLSLANTGIIYMDSGANVSGGVTSAQLAPVNANATALNNFVIGGGGLFTQSQIGLASGYGWLTTLIPGLVVQPSVFNDGVLQLTPEGVAAFPGLTDDEISLATPWHNWFSGNFGSLEPLVLGPGNGPLPDDAVVLGGGAGGAIICGTPGAPACPEPPTGVPEPSTLLLLGSGLFGLVRARRRKA